MVRLSERLRAVAGLVGEGHVLADVGTDHGFVPIYLLQQGRISHAIAMDINRGPLERAREHILQSGLQDYIETRLSDGVAELAPGEADAILIAGMGGGLTLHILEDGQEVCRQAKELVLQPQSQHFRVRVYLAEHGYVVDGEEMVAEDGKFYPMMRVHWDGTQPDTPEGADMPDDISAEGAMDTERALRRDTRLLYGAKLLDKRHPVLGMYLEKEQRNLTGILKELGRQPQTGHISKRMWEVEYRLACNRLARAYYE